MIGTHAFQNCTSLTKTNFPAATYIYDNAFYNCTSLTEVSFPAATNISSFKPFGGCSSLTLFNLSGSGHLSVIEGGKALVRNNTELVSYPAASGSITLNEITSIGGYAFQNCTSLTEVSFPAATSIDYDAFENCTSLTAVSFPVAASIGRYAFINCTSLTEVSFPAATSIDYGAFYVCTSLTAVSFPMAMSTGDSAFYGCTSLTEVNFSVATIIDSQAFYKCTSLTSVNFPAATGIGEIAFSDCTSLTNLNIPSVTSISVRAFGFFDFTTNGTALTITMGNVAPTVGTRVFGATSASAKTVTVKVPAMASGYQASPTNTTANNWGNAFRGRGWDGTNFLDGTVNENIQLTIVYE